ncbi:MAG: hypothetical protein JKY56_05735 [Kofleriaceae bacterium]|nr:hypothetical protein [Kofleriaceae bacterium]
MRPKDIVQRFLASIGRQGDAAEYLALFQAEKKSQFALIVVTEEALSQSPTALVADLLFLRKLELTPLLCASNQTVRESLLGLLPDKLLATASDSSEVTEHCKHARLPVLMAASAADRAALVKRLAVRRVLYMVDQAGLQPQGEALRSLVNLRTDYSALSAPGVLTQSQVELLREVRTVFDDAEHTFTVSITSAHDLLRELFTLKGAGTLVRRGTEVARYNSYQETCEDRLNSLLESAFSRPIAAAFYQRPIREVFIAADYRGAAIVEESPLAPYLSKFAVNLRAQGEGIGGDIWRALRKRNPRIFWRSRPGNPIVGWYTSQCDGFVRGSEWTVFWCGLAFDEIAQAAELAHAAPSDFGGS